MKSPVSSIQKIGFTVYLCGLEPELHKSINRCLPEKLSLPLSTVHIAHATIRPQPKNLKKHFFRSIWLSRHLWDRLVIRNARVSGPCSITPDGGGGKPPIVFFPLPSVFLIYCPFLSMYRQDPSFLHHSQPF